MANDGWTHETNLVHLWIANDGDLYNEVQDELEQFIIDEEDPEQDDVNACSAWLHDWVDGMIPDLPGIVNDLLSSALSEVDWYAIAELLISDYRENMDYTSQKIDEEYAELCEKETA